MTEGLCHPFAERFMPELLARVVGRGPQNLMTVHIVTGKMTTEMNVVFSEFRLRLALADEGLFGGGCCFVQRSNHQIPHTAELTEWRAAGLGKDWTDDCLGAEWATGRGERHDEVLVGLCEHTQQGLVVGCSPRVDTVGGAPGGFVVVFSSVVLGACCAVNVRAFPMSQILLPLFHTHKTG